jgi:hypothetical protein
MDAIASYRLAIGLDLDWPVFVLVAVLTLWALRDGRGFQLKIKIPSPSLDLRVWPREVPEKSTPPQGTGSDDDPHTICVRRVREEWISSKERVLRETTEARSTANSHEIKDFFA